MKETLSWNEYLDWHKYRSKFGPLNPSLRFEAGLARLAWIVSGLIGSERDVDSYLQIFVRGYEPVAPETEDGLDPAIEYAFRASDARTR